MPVAATAARTLAAAMAALVLVLVMVGETAAQGLVAVPPLTARVTDLTGTLTSQQQASLERTLQEFETRKGSQVAVVLVATTQPEEIEQYAIRVVDAWKLGREGVDDGALLLIAKDDRAMRIEVGRGLEGVVPDILAKRIIADTMTPHFQRGDFFRGIEAGIGQLLGLIDGEPLPQPDPGWQGDPMGLQGILPLLLIVSMVAGGVLRQWLGRLPGALTTGCIVGTIAWMIAGLVVIGLLAAVIGFAIALMGGASGGRWANGRRGGWGGGGGAFGGGGFGGGGFRGGGGGFSGGGASGRW